METIEVESKSALVSFLSHKEEIRDLLEAGHSCRWIHQKLSAEQRLPLTYRHFLRLCEKFLAGSSPRKKYGSKAPQSDSSHGEHERKGPLMNFEKDERKSPESWNISTIGKDYLLKPAEKK